MISALIFLSLTFYQDTYTYESDIVRFETGKTYVQCQDSLSCPSATDKTLKKRERIETVSNGKNELASANPEPHRKITLPIIEDMKKQKFIQKEAAPIEKVSITSDSVMNVAEKAGDRESSPPVKRPFAVKPHGYYEPDKAEELLAKLEKEETAEKNIQVISRVEVNFMTDDQGLYISSADKHMLEAMKDRYRGHLLRFEGYGLDEKEAQWMILSVMEALEPGEIQNIQTHRDEDKRLVIVEVLNEI